MAKLSSDLTTSGLTRVAFPLHPRENLFLVSTIAAATAGTTINADGCGTFVLTLSGTFVATVLVEASNDGFTNVVTLPMKPINAASTLLVVSATAAGQFVGFNPGYTQVRIRCSAYTSGTVSYSLVNSNDQTQAFYAGLMPNSVVTITAAAAAAATLTLPAPGAGLRQYLTNLRIERHTSALLTAGATPTILTTTNLPGSLAFSIPADAAAQGVVYKIEDFWQGGLGASAQNTAVTVVAGAVTAVIWRMTASYFVAP